ncbi:hypothetical protein K458DRAFT_418683 [Lentithecium fluviatile CBS 122367]|uniref:Uncharacterized protein n=1 Tax=Lentithecium fluviatile CBS 122367 TaxID=1168545 RepID=A0A6G1IZJ8_9PLEO|nr:hypothetical protein K458DRAFT_418683 [Lentithecium fluviatile CBS 122367]
MTPILSTVLFASAAAASITTSIWLPGSPSDSENYEFKASVVGAEGDQVTLAVQIDDGYYTDSTETITFHGSTAFENVVTTTDSYGDYEGDLTISYGCSKQGNRPVCVYSSNGPVAWSSYCEMYTDYTDVVTSTMTYTYDSPASTVEQVETISFNDVIPGFCRTGSLLPESYAINTVSVRASQVQTYAITITAGEEKLSATAGATPTNSGASATTTGNVTPTGSPSGSNSTIPASSPTTGGPAQQTSNAAAMVTVAPALAGLGALVAALL